MDRFHDPRVSGTKTFQVLQCLSERASRVKWREFLHVLCSPNFCKPQRALWFGLESQIILCILLPKRNKVHPSQACSFWDSDTSSRFAGNYLIEGGRINIKYPFYLRQVPFLSIYQGTTSDLPDHTMVPPIHLPAKSSVLLSQFWHRLLQLLIYLSLFCLKTLKRRKEVSHMDGCANRTQGTKASRETNNKGNEGNNKLDLRVYAAFPLRGEHFISRSF